MFAGGAELAVLGLGLASVLAAAIHFRRLAGLRDREIEVL